MLTQIFREGNTAADALAKLGLRLPHSDIQRRKYCSGRLSQARTKIALWRVKALEHSPGKYETNSGT